VLLPVLPQSPRTAMVVVALSTRIHGYWRFLARLLVNGSAECGGP
jgi:hypothetical protein